MRKETLNGHKIEFFDDISELSVERFHQYSRYMLVASGVGDSIDDIDKHINKIMALLTRDVKKAQQELLNLRQNIFLVAHQRDIRHKAFMFLAKSVDGEDWKDFSDKGIEELYQIVNGESLAKFDAAMRDVILEIDDQLQRYFPEMFNDAEEKNYCDFLRKRALLQMDEIQNGSDHSEEIEKLSDEIWKKYEPKSFENDKSVVDYDRQFENMCLILSKEFSGGVKGYTVMEFYSAYHLLKEQQKEIKKLNRKTKK